MDIWLLDSHILHEVSGCCSAGWAMNKDKKPWTLRGTEGRSPVVRMWTTFKMYVPAQL